MKWIRRFRQNSQARLSVLLTAAVFAAGFMAGSLSTVGRMSAAALDDADEAFEPFWDAFAIN